jgi:hypothetical protein
MYLELLRSGETMPTDSFARFSRRLKYPPPDSPSSFTILLDIIPQDLAEVSDAIPNLISSRLLLKGGHPGATLEDTDHLRQRQKAIWLGRSMGKENARNAS